MTDNDTAQDILLDVADGGYGTFAATVSECLSELAAGYDEVTVDICAAVTVLFAAAQGIDYGPSVQDTLETRAMFGFGAPLSEQIAAKANGDEMQALAEGIVAYAAGPTLAELGASEAFIAAYRAKASRLEAQVGETAR
ncbi:hypothetical protein [Litorisediminicola beolgyonensis]|uniref:hypothetical protein n=1 Tax=Litorisediminicola beolgyonensis TaxID=1173614 RepID=UPI0036DC3486